MHCSVCQSKLGETEITAHGDLSNDSALVCVNCMIHPIRPVQTERRESASKAEIVFMTNEEASQTELAGLEPPGRAAPRLAPKPPKRKRRKRATSPALKNDADPPEQTIKSARAVAQAWKDSVTKTTPTVGSANSNQPKFRIDAAHQQHEPQQPTSKTSRVDSSSSTEMTRLDPSRDSISSARRAITFGLLIFMLGQIAVQWGFFAGHFPVWSIGTLFSIGGIAISLLSVSECFKRVERQMGKPVRRKRRRSTTVKAR